MIEGDVLDLDHELCNGEGDAVGDGGGWLGMRVRG